MRGSRGQHYRLADIDRRIREGEYPSVDRLAQEHGVSKSTVRRDLHFLRYQMGAPIEYDRQRRGYCYSQDDPCYLFPALTLTEGEILALIIAEQVLQPLENTELTEQMRRAVDRLYRFLPQPVSCRLMDLSNLVSYTHAAVQRLDLSIFSSLLRATLRHRQIKVTYHSLSSQEVTRNRVLDPYHLGNRDGVWYLFAYCHLRNQIRMFVPGRVSRVEETGLSFTVPDDFHPNEYLAGGFRVIVGEGDYRVRIRFTPKMAPYLRQKRWHPSQKLDEQPDGSVILTLRLTTLEEIVSWALSFGDGAVALEPPELRERVQQTLRRALRAYLEEG